MVRFARAIMSGAAAHGAPSVPVEAITTADHPTPRAPAGEFAVVVGKLADTYGIALPPWQASLGSCLDELLRSQGNEADAHALEATIYRWG